MMEKYLNALSIPKEQKLLQPELIKLLEFGQLILENVYKFWRVILMKFFLVHLIMRERQLFQVKGEEK
jgi:hypothetical protein